MADAGWWGEKELIGPDGVARKTRFDPARLKLIFDVNTRMAWSAGRWQRIQAAKASHPYLRYVTRADERVRQSPRVWHNVTLPVEDPWWQTHYPPNGCGCRVVGASSPAGARRLGGKPEYDTPPPGWDARDARGRLPGIDEGWDYRPGATRQPWDKHAFAPECAGPASHGKAQPCIRAVDGQRTFADFARPRARDIEDALRMEAPALLPKAASRQAAVEQLASALGVSAARPRRWIETEIPVPALSKVMIEYGYLAHMVDKDHDARERYAHFILPTLIRPFEAWATLYDDGAIRPRLISLFRGKRQIAVILRINRDGSLFYNVMNADDKRIDDFRVGELLYGR